MKSSRSTIIRPYQLGDLDSVLRLNEAVVDFTSPLDARRYELIRSQGCLDLVAELDGEVVGFLLGLARGAAYANGNYEWFSERYHDFIYIDRVVVDGRIRGAGIGNSLYTHAFEWSQRQRLKHVAAEIDIEPPNTASLRFHDRFGFEEVGNRQLANGKTVSMQVRTF